MHKIVLEIRLIIKKCVQDVLGKIFERNVKQINLAVEKMHKNSEKSSHSQNGCKNIGIWFNASIDKWHFSMYLS